MGTYFYFKSSGKKKIKQIETTPISKFKEDSALSSEDIGEKMGNILLLGYGGAGHSGGGLTDVMILINPDLERNRVNLISIPRDLFIEDAGGEKINKAYTAGEGAVKGIVNKVTGMNVDYLVAIDFDNFKKAIDSLGGIKVNVPVTFDDYFYPIKGEENNTCGKTGDEIKNLTNKFSGFDLEKQFTCRYEHLHFDKGPKGMDGETALKFVRSRHSNQHGGDFARSERQFSVLSAIFEKLISGDGLSRTDEFFKQFKNMVKTDLTPKYLKEIAGSIKNPQNIQIKRVSLSTDNVLKQSTVGRQFVLLVKNGGNWSIVHSYLKTQLGKQ